MLATALPPVLPSSVAAQAPSAPAGNGDSDGSGSFARLLDAAEARRQPQAHKAPEPRIAQQAAAEEKEGAASVTAAETRSTEPMTFTGEPGPAPATVADAAIEEPMLADTAAVTAAVTDTAALLAGLAALPPAPAPVQGELVAVATGARAGLRGTTAAADDTGTRTSARNRLDPLSTADTDPRLADAAVAPGSGAHTAAPRNDFKPPLQQALGEAAAAHKADMGAPRPEAVTAPDADARPAGVDSPAPGAALLATAATPGTTPGAPAAVGHARLAAIPGSPEFAGQLGAQLTTFVRDGVQHARLELHPVELGPVTVQIAIDGAQARVNLAAEHAATRQALEQAMPALAGSLREAGLTLSGGGVFEQPRQPQPEGGAGTREGRSGRDGGNGRGETGDSAGTGMAPRADASLRRRGVVDLVA